MRLFLGIFIFGTSLISAQNKELTLEELMSGTFYPDGMQEIRSMADGGYFTLLESDASGYNTALTQYDYATGNKIGALMHCSDFPELTSISGYEFSHDEAHILIAAELKPVYRHSALGRYYIFNRSLGTLTLLSAQWVQEPTFSPDGTKVAFVKDNDIYYQDLQSNQTVRVTHDGQKNKIINGLTDWVYEEEFAFVRAFEWSLDGKYIAYLKFDETAVMEFSMDVYGDELYPTQEVFKYPKAGTPNAIVDLYLYDVTASANSQIDLSAFEYAYIPRLKWTKDPEVWSIQLSNRAQNKLDLIFVNAQNKAANLVHTEDDLAYVSVRDDLTFLKDNSFIWSSEMDGWRHLFHYARDGELIRQITKGPWEVTAFYGFDPLTGRLYFQSTERGSIYRDLYSVSVSGKNKVRLSQDFGTNSAAFSKTHQYFIQTHSSSAQPNLYTLHRALDGEVLRTLVTNQDLKNRLKAYDIAPKEFSVIEINQELLNMYMIKPTDFDPSQTYPVMLFQYSGPGSQSVADNWMGQRDYWHQILVQKGVIVVCVDGRGTGYKGRDFKKMTQYQLGKYEVQDQISVALELSKLPYIAADRIGIWGWSYGGFMSANALFQGAGIFSMAISVAPVTSWRYYDTIYTERYMGLPQDNPSGYDNNSPLSHVDQMEGDFLLIHGSADDNVHVQNTMRLTEALIESGKDFQWRIYPDKNHGIRGGKTSLNLYRAMTDFVSATLLNANKQSNNQ
jgi:dipeptidyl-peptidase 4